MVLTKAFIEDRKSDLAGFFARNDENGVGHSEQMVVDLRSGHEFDLFTGLTASLFAAHENIPDITSFSFLNNPSDPVNLVDNLNFTEIDESDDDEEENIIPLDYTSNTGYGFWKTETAEIRQPDQEWERSGTKTVTTTGAVPLDHGNTITEGMSKLFPRVP